MLQNTNKQPQKMTNTHDEWKSRPRQPIKCRCEWITNRGNDSHPMAHCPRISEQYNHIEKWRKNLNDFFFTFPEDRLNLHPHIRLVNFIHIESSIFYKTMNYRRRTHCDHCCKIPNTEEFDRNTNNSIAHRVCTDQMRKIWLVLIWNKLHQFFDKFIDFRLISRIF